METRVPVPSYNLRSNSSYIDGSKSARDLDNGDGRHVGEIDGTEHDGVTGGDLDNDGESSAVVSFIWFFVIFVGKIVNFD